jgi:hypothetical protein
MSVEFTEVKRMRWTQVTNFLACSLEGCDITLRQPSLSELNGATSGTVTEQLPRAQAIDDQSSSQPQFFYCFVF